MMIKFICGCETKEIIARKNIKTMSMVTFDDEGFLVCAVHHARRYGWRSIPNLAGLKLSDWAFKTFSPLEIEGWLLFGDELHGCAARPKFDAVEDRRDNRDPQSITTR